MRRRVGLAVLVVAGLAVAGFALHTAGVFRWESVLGCRLSSVNEAKFVAANRKMLKEIPVYPGSTLISESTNGWAVAKDRCLPFENRGPYDSYATFVRYAMPPRTEFAQVDAFLRKALHANGWTLRSYSGTSHRQYGRGEATLTVRGIQDTTYWELIAVHKYR